MKTNDEILKGYLQERLGDYIHPVDDTLWASLAVYVPRKRNRKLSVLVIAGIGAALVAVGAILFTGKEDAGFVDIPQMPLSENIQPDLNVHSELAPVVATTTADGPEIPPRKTTSVMIAVPENDPVLMAEAVTAAPGSAGEIAEDGPDGEPAGDGQKETASHDLPTESVPSDHRKAVIPSSDNYPKPKRKGNGNMSLLLAFNGAGANSAMPEPMLEAGPKPPILGNDGRPIDPKDAHYDRSVNFALTVRKKITRRLALETGLNYSYLHTMVSNRGTDITLHYVGIPVKVVYTVVDWRRLSAYGSAYGMIERQVAGKLEDRVGSRNLVTSKLQWSVGASAGIEFTLVKRLGLFAEPGIVYYFDDGSNIPTIRKDKPLDFSLQIGLRFNID